MSTRLLAALVAVAVAGCGDKRATDMLVVYSGDCQAYLDPCG